MTSSLLGQAGGSGHGWLQSVWPLLAAAIALAFAVRLIKRLAVKWRPHEAVWCLALLMFTAASGAMFAGVLHGWTSPEFRTYWLFGAVLNVPYLAQGELYLMVSRRRIGHAFLLLLLAGTAFAAWHVIRAPLHPTPLSKALPLGKDAFGDSSAPYRLSQLYAFPAYFLLLGGLVWAAATMKGKPHLRDRTTGTLLIAAGATVVAIGSGVGAGFDVVPLFSVSLATGIAVMFWGFVVASRPPRPVAA